MTIKLTRVPGMAADQKANERAYNGLKASILSGELRIRQRLDIEMLARRLNVSATPVRQALALLVAERLVSVHSTRIYHVAFWSEYELRDLYTWRGMLARLALETYAPALSAWVQGAAPDYSAAFTQIMLQIETGANPELRRSARAADERLSLALAAEPEVFSDAVQELQRLDNLLGQGGPALRRALRRFFKRRVEASALIRARAHARAIPRNGD